MALVSRLGGRGGVLAQVPLRQLSTNGSQATTGRGRKAAYTVLGLAGVGATGVVVALENSKVHAVDLITHPSHYEWPHNKILASFDHAAIRRGYEVYKQVCAACHSLQFIAYRNLVGVCFTEDEAKREAEEVMVTDGPNDAGEMYQRPGKLSDYFQSPYANEEAARAANNGAYPPDLSFITLARHGGEDYIFSLLTGYTEPPAGIELREGQHYNPYFPGGAIGMSQMLFDEALEYEDGTPATASQLAKDVTCFLKWCSEFEHDARKQMFVKVMLILPVLTFVSWYMKRVKWSSLKSRKIVYNPKKYDE